MAVSKSYIQGYNFVVNVYPSGTASAQLHPNLNSVTFRFDRANQDVTTFGDTTIQRLAGLRDWTMDFAGLWTGSAASQSAESATFLDMVASGNTIIALAPASVTGCPVYTGCGLLTNVTLTSTPNGAVALSFSVQAAAGSLTRGFVA